MTTNESKPISQQVNIDYLVASSPDHQVSYNWYKSFIVQPGRTHFKKTGHNLVTEAYLNGYHGHKFMDTKVLFNKTHGIIWASGRDANYTWLDVVPQAKKVSRIDLAVTVEYQEETTGMIERYYDQAKLDYGGKRKVTYLRNSQGGQTLYVGSFKSDQFGRVYYKDVEQGQETTGKVVRYEVVMRNDISTHFAKELCKGDPQHRQDAIRDVTIQWFKSRGLRIALDSKVPYIQLYQSKALTSPDRSLLWLQKQVRPTILKLFSQGYAQEVERAIGIQIVGLLDTSATPKKVDHPPEYQQLELFPI